MDDEFEDDGLDDIMSQIDICQNPPPPTQQIINKKDDDKFKKPAEPKYSFNRFQEPRLLSQNSQKNNQQQNQSNQANQQQQNKFNQQNNVNNTTYTKSNLQTKQLPNQTTNNGFVKPQTPTLISQKPNNNNQLNNLNNNLTKSVKAQIGSQFKYSVNRQNLTQINSKSIQPIQINNKSTQQNQINNKSNQPNQFSNKSTQSTKINKSISSASSNNQTNSTITDFSVILSTQSQSATQTSSSSTIHSQFSISDNVSTKLTFDPSAKKIDLGVDPKDKYIGKIQMLEKLNNKLKEDVEKANRECLEKLKIIEELKEIQRLKDEQIQTIKAFNEQEKTTREFKETVLNTTIDKNSPIINKGKSTTTLQFKKPSPKSSTSSNQNLATQFTQCLNLQNDTSMQIHDLNFESDVDDNISDDSSVIGPTQYEIKSSQKKSNELNLSIAQSTSLNSNEISSPNTIKNENQLTSEINKDKVHYDDELVLPETQPQTQSTDDIVISETQPLSETVKEENEAEKENETDEISETKIINKSTQPIKISKSETNKTNIKRIKIIPETEEINDEIMKQLDNDDAIFHKSNLKFTDFSIYDYLEEEGEINLSKDNLNPYYDQILDRINILERINKEIRIKELDDLDEEDKKEALKKLNEFNLFYLIKDYEFGKFNKLNEGLILKFLFNFDLETMIPEYTFNLLTNLFKYNDYLENKNIVSKLTNKCITLGIQDNKFQNGHSFLNRILYFLSSFNEIKSNETKNYQRLCYSIIQFLVQNTVEFNNIKEFHKFKLNKNEKDRCLCWKELYNVLGEFALYILEEFDIKNKLHYLIVKELTKFIINLNRTKFQEDNCIGIARFSYFAQKMSLKLECCYLDFLH